ncbi:MAG: ABC transporter substrate-binding protein [Treponema sp.]|jgi:iron complex transport system substrate-binding protein|nr:ABC transporter substrate-binding protein [Treponema sp.]
MFFSVEKLKVKVLFIILSLFVVGTVYSRAAAEAPARSQADYKRIISAAPSNTEILIGLGFGDRLIAIDPYSGDIPGVPSGLPTIDFFYPDIEAVIGMAPDLILVNEINSYGVADNPFKLLGDLGIRVVDVPTSVSIQGIYNDIIMIAEVLGVKERGEALVASMREEVQRIAAASATAQKKRVYFEVSPAPYIYSLGSATYLNEIIEIAGGINIFADQRGWFSPSAEEIILRDPEIIFTFVYADEDAIGEIKSRQAFGSITAIRLNQVYVIDNNSASRPSQNIITALREMARAISGAR